MPEQRVARRGGWTVDQSRCRGGVCTRNETAGGSSLCDHGPVSFRFRWCPATWWVTVILLITTMLPGATSTSAEAQQVTKKAPSEALLPGQPEGALQVPREGLPDAPDLPVAKVVPDETGTVPVDIVSDTQSKIGSVFTLDGGVVIHYLDRVVEADHIEFDQDTNELTATGHLHVSGGKNHEEMRASHGSVNLKTQLGRFYDVTGSVGVKTNGKRLTYVNGNPFLFSGREVVKTGDATYEVHDGTVTSCRLPRPDWLFSAGLFSMDDERAKAKDSVFKLLNVPVFYLPYVSHPIDSETRQTGVLIPIIGQSSTKGLVLGEQIYFALSRSTDLTVGTEYFSRRGWMDDVAFRHRGRGDDTIQARYNQLFDRGIGFGSTYTNQGGEDLTFLGRHDVSPETRLAANIEYLSSYVYREAFSESFNQAVSTDIVSYGYGVHAANGYTESVEADRYQGLKQVTSALGTVTSGSGQQVRIFHVPSFNLSATDHRVARTGLTWNFDGSAAGLKRVQPNFVTNGVTERVDLHPSIAYPLSAGGWVLRPVLGARETFYSRSRQTEPGQLAAGVGPTPLERSASINRLDFEAGAELRAPVLERTFEAPWLKRLAGGSVRHAIEPVVAYRYATGVDNFRSLLRFDDRDVVSDTNEVEYGVTQRLFTRAAAKDSRCGAAPVDLDTPAPVSEVYSELPAAAAPRCTTREWVSWRVAQKTFFNQTFGNAVVAGRRNIFSTTLDFAGVAFLTEPRQISPVISRLRVRTSDTLDIEWDADLDTGAKKFTANNVLLDLHRGNRFAGVSYARLNAPGRSYVEGVGSLTSDFDQMRLLVGYGKPTKAGLSMAANAGLDLDRTQLQYGAIQTSYNWDCCGFSVEYRKYELGAVRNENAYRFNLTLANIGTAGNLKRAERLF